MLFRSLWPGYLKEPSGRRLVESLRRAELPFVLDHASGHAPVADLKRLAEALQPSSLVPIHTEAADRYGGIFKNVTRHDDGEWWAA